MQKCKVCGSEDFHKPNSYMCELIMSPCKHEWGDLIELPDSPKCFNCGKRYSVYQCKKCPMHSVLHWSESFYHDNGGCMK